MTARPIIACTTYSLWKDYPGRRMDVHGLMPEYTEPLRRVGAIPLLVPLHLDREELKAVLDRVDGLYIPGGGDLHPSCYGGDGEHPTLAEVHTSRDQAELTLFLDALDRDMPILGVCRGLQLMNVALGGTLWEDVYQDMPNAIEHTYKREDLGFDYCPHTVEIVSDSCLGSIFQEASVPVNSLHHQGIRDLGEGLRVTATAPDGLVEAIELPGQRFVLSVQWHPEHLFESDPRNLDVFGAFVNAI